MRATTCCFALFFIEDMQEQLRNIASKIKENGKVVVTSFYENSFSPPVDVFFSCLERYGIEPPTMTWKRVATVEKCSSLFENVGMKSIYTEQIDAGYSLNSPDEWWQIVWNGGFRGLVEQLEEDDLVRFREEHLAEVGQLSNGEGIRIEIGVIYTIGSV